MATKNKVALENYQFDDLSIQAGTTTRKGLPKGDTATFVEPRPEIDGSFAIDNFKTYYYSGGQAQIYLEDVFLDEVTNLSFTTVTNKSPIYGYSSERFDTVAKGNMIVQGSFNINFISTGYLQIISEVVRSGSVRRGKDEDEKEMWLNGVKFRTTGDATAFEVTQALNQMRGLGNKEFRQLSQNMRKRRSSQPALNKQFYELPPFDIYAVFGDARTAKHENGNHTVRTIKDVYLTGQSQVVSASGEPIQEQYTFIARDIG